MTWTRLPVLLLAFTVVGWASAQEPKTIQGKVVKVQGPENLLILRTTDGKDVRILVEEKVPISMNGQAVRLLDLNEGATVAIIYDFGNDRFVARSVAVNGGLIVVPSTVVKGTVVRVLSDPNVLVIRTADAKEMAIGMEQATTIKVGTRDVRLVNLTPGMEVVLTYQLRAIATAIVTPAAPVVVPVAPAADARPLIRGKIVKVLGTDNVFIVDAGDGKQVRFFVSDTSVLRVNDRNVKLVDLRADMPVAVEYVMRDDQYVVSSLQNTAAVVAAVPAAATGQIRGRVLEGDRPQPNQEVNLLTGTGVVAATVRTLPDGTFKIDNVAPGTYTLSAIKLPNNTKAAERVTVQGGEIGTVVLSLLR